MQVLTGLGERHVSRQSANVFLDDLAGSLIQTDDDISRVGSFGPTPALPVSPRELENADGGQELAGGGAAILFGFATGAGAERRPLFSTSRMRCWTVSAKRFLVSSRPLGTAAASQASRTVPSGAERAKAWSSS